MKRLILVVVALSAGVGAVAAQQDVAEQQDKLMKGLAKPMYGVIGRTVRGQSAYDQAAIDAALVQLEEGVGKIAGVFATNPKEDVFGADYGSSQKIWQNKADFDAKIPPVTKAIADAKGKIKDADSLKAAYTAINDRCNDCHETYRVKLK
jgi:cytochrome c556